ncbi:MAG: M23 family metallopeptidase [Patescibacteria group bacterium]
MPVSAHAFWPSSALIAESLISRGYAVGGGKEDNIQTMDLPRPTMALNPFGGIGGGDIELVSETALLPQEGPMGTILEIEEGSKSAQISSYVVKPGDTLSEIATMFDVSINTIMWANDLSTTKSIKPGQTLVILPVTGIRYTVKNGGTLRDIVKKYGGDLDEASRYNNIDPDEALEKGMVVLVPDAELHVPKPASPNQSTSRVVRGASGPSYEGYYTHPVPGARRTQGLHGYNGVDMGAPIGTPVYAAAAGEAIIARASGWNGGYGKYIVVHHSNGTQTLYAHLSENVIGEGVHVSQGELIGYVGSTGRSTGPHLHFEVRGAKNPF